jgi:hypothetical protein
LLAAGKRPDQRQGRFSARGIDLAAWWHSEGLPSGQNAPVSQFSTLAGGIPRGQKSAAPDPGNCLKADRREAEGNASLFDQRKSLQPGQIVLTDSIHVAVPVGYAEQCRHLLRTEFDIH